MGTSKKQELYKDKCDRFYIALRAVCEMETNNLVVLDALGHLVNHIIEQQKNPKFVRETIVKFLQGEGEGAGKE